MRHVGRRVESNAKDCSVAEGDEEVVLHEIVKSWRSRADWRSSMVLQTESRAGGKDPCGGREIKESIEKSAPSTGVAGSRIGESLRA